jgi:hypothetical protein
MIHLKYKPRDKKLGRYLSSGRKRVEGWMARVDAEVFSDALESQNERGVIGGSMEIGIHHGKSFIPLSLCMRPGEVAIAIDIFDRQDLNIGSKSGSGNFGRFLSNVRQHGNEHCIRVIPRSSLEVRPDQIREMTPELRFVSVDGGHWYDVVLNDLRLAAACAGEDCVIAVDDVFNPDYAEVVAAYFAWQAAEPNFIPFAASHGKLYLCRPGAQSIYQGALMDNPYLKYNRKKVLEYMGGELFVFTGNYSGWKNVVKKRLEIHAPSVYHYLRAKVRTAGDAGGPPARSPGLERDNASMT